MMMHARPWIVQFVFAWLLLACQTLPAAPLIEWTRQLGTTGTDQAAGIGSDSSGNIFVTGRTNASLDGVHQGGYDIFLRKYDSSGNLHWAKQLGTPENDLGWDVTVDAAGNSYVAGEAGVSLDGAAGLGAFVSKYDPDGNEIWITQFGSYTTDQALQVSVDSSDSVYVSGVTRGDAFIHKFDSNGSYSWARQFGSIFSEVAWSVAAGDTGVYVTGEEQNDMFLRKYTTDGDLLWTQVIEGAYVRGYGVSIDGLGNVFVGGNSGGIVGETHYGRFDGYVAKYNPEGALQWLETLGTSENDNAADVVADGFGNVYVTGFTSGAFPGEVGDERDFYVAKYDTAGTQQWLMQLGTSSLDNAFSLSTDGLGGVYIAGDTGGVLQGSSFGGFDAFLMKISDIPNSSRGDFDQDGDVDGRDFLAWQRGETGNPTSAADFEEWQANFGARHIPLVALATTVPEPAGYSLILLTSMWALNRRNQTKSCRTCRNHHCFVLP